MGEMTKNQKKFFRRYFVHGDKKRKKLLLREGRGGGAF